MPDPSTAAARGVPDDDKRIVLVISGLARGGAETQLLRLAHELVARRWTVRIVALRDPEDFAEELGGLDVVSFGMQQPRKALVHLPTSMIRLMREMRPTVALSFLFHANLATRVAARLTGVPVVVSSYRSTEFGGAWRERMLRWTCGMDDATVTNSVSSARASERRGNAMPDRLEVVPNVIDVASYRVARGRRQAARQELGVGEADFLWLAVGRLDPPKDYPTMVRAFARVPDGAGRVLLHVAGEGPERRDVEREIERLDLTTRVRLLGLRSDVPSLLNAADGLVLSSVHEGMPNALMEACAAGLPVVATDVGGVSEIVDHETSGLLVPPSDAASLATAMIRVGRLPEPERAAMGRKGRESVEARYGTGPVVDRWEGLFAHLLERRRGRTDARARGTRS